MRTSRGSGVYPVHENEFQHEKEFKTVRVDEDYIIR